jgi:hypothetical protein
MKKHTGHTPPKWADRLLGWYCRPELLEDLQGDLHEYFDRNLADKGLKKARINFILDVFKFMRPYTIKKVNILNNITDLLNLTSRQHYGLFAEVRSVHSSIFLDLLWHWVLLY